MKPHLPISRFQPRTFVRFQSNETLVSSLKSRQFAARSEKLEALPQQLLYKFLEDFLPPPPSYYETNRFLNPGSHLVHFSPAFAERDLLPDGTDLDHAPDPSYKYRLWAGGTVTYPRTRPIEFSDPVPAVLKESIVDAKAQGNDKVWVKIRRPINRHRGSVFQLVPIVDEDRWLVFSMSKPTLDLKTIISPPTEPSYSVSIKPTNALLFRFSALTLNAHAVHIDPEYTKNVYGLPDLLVHGPLTYVLMMEVLARAQDKFIEGHKLYPLVKQVEYRNLKPIFVGEEITICCKPVSQDSLGPPIEIHPRQIEPEKRTWDIWIQKMVNGEPSLCVKGSAVVDYIHENHINFGNRKVRLDD